MNYLNRWFSLVALVCAAILVAQHSRAENRIRQAAPATHETENSPAATTIRALEQRAEEATVSGDTTFSRRFLPVILPTPARLAKSRIRPNGSSMWRGSRSYLARL